MLTTIPEYRREVVTLGFHTGCSVRRVLFAHGLEGSPDGAKARALREAGLDVIAPDGRGLGLAERVEGLERASEGARDLVLAGSSYGGVAAAVVAGRHPERFAGLVLLAPALVFREPPTLIDPEAVRVPPGLPCTVLHATADEVIPVEVSRALARRCPHVVLRELDDDHVLRRSLPAIVAAVREHLGGRIG